MSSGQKAGGQALLGGLDVLVSRNFFGAQINSFEALLPAPACLDDKRVIGNDPNEAYRAVFIRAPAIMECGPSVEVLAEYQLSPSEREAQVSMVIVESAMVCCLLSPCQVIPGRIILLILTVTLQVWHHYKVQLLRGYTINITTHSPPSSTTEPLLR